MIGPPLLRPLFFFKVLFFPLAHGVRSGAPKLQISLAPLEKKSCRGGDEMEKGLCQASWTRWRVNCLQMESCSTSEVGGEEGLGAFKGRIEPGTRKLRGDGRDKEKMEKWTWEKKNLEEQASGKGQIGGGEPDLRDQQQMDALLQHATQLGAKPRTEGTGTALYSAVQCSGVECDGTGSRPPRAYGREKSCVCDCQGIRYYRLRLMDVSFMFINS